MLIQTIGLKAWLWNEAWLSVCTVTVYMPSGKLWEQLCRIPHCTLMTKKNQPQAITAISSETAIPELWGHEGANTAKWYLLRKQKHYCHSEQRWCCTHFLKYSQGPSCPIAAVERKMLAYLVTWHWVAPLHPFHNQRQKQCVIKTFAKGSFCFTDISCSLESVMSQGLGCQIWREKKWRGRRLWA